MWKLNKEKKRYYELITVKYRQTHYSYSALSSVKRKSEAPVRVC